MPLNTRCDPLPCPDCGKVMMSWLEKITHHDHCLKNPNNVWAQFKRRLDEKLRQNKESDNDPIV